MILITRQEDAFLSLKLNVLAQKMFRMISCLFSKTRQLFIDNCLKIQLIVLSNSRLFFLELVKIVIQNSSSGFNDFSNPLLNQKTLMEFILD